MSALGVAAACIARLHFSRRARRRQPAMLGFPTRCRGLQFESYDSAGSDDADTDGAELDRDGTAGSHAGAGTLGPLGLPGSSADEGVARLGPRSLNDILSTHRRNMMKLISRATQEGRGEEVLQQVRALNRHGLIITTSFSGTGSAEAAGIDVMTCIAEIAGVGERKFGKSPIHVWSASELAEEGQILLLRTSGHAKPAHIFTDIAFRLPEDVRRAVSACETEFLEQWANIKLPEVGQAFFDVIINDRYILCVCKTYLHINICDM